MLGGCLSPLANLLPYCHESHPWKSLSLRLSRISFFLPRSFTRSPSPFALAQLLPFFFLLFIPPPPSCHVAIFHRTRNGLSVDRITRWSHDIPNFPWDEGRLCFFKISHTLGNGPPFSVQIPSQSFRIRRQFVDASNSPRYLDDYLHVKLIGKKIRIAKFQNSIRSFGS